MKNKQDEMIDHLEANPPKVVWEGKLIPVSRGVISDSYIAGTLMGNFPDLETSEYYEAVKSWWDRKEAEED